jgi:hypothetical protein
MGKEMKLKWANAPEPDDKPVEKPRPAMRVQRPKVLE